MGLNKHLHSRNKVKKNPQSAQLDAQLPPAHRSIEHGREDGDTRHCVQDSGNSKPEQIHAEHHLNGVTAQYIVMQIARRVPAWLPRLTWERRLQALFQNLKASLGYLHIVLRLSAAERDDRVSCLDSLNHPALPTELTSHGRPLGGSAVLERIGHLSRLGIGDAQEII